MRSGSGEGKRRMSAPSLADPISVLRLTPSSITRVENSRPTTTATAMMTIAVLVFAALMLRATSAVEFRKDTPLFSNLRPKPRLQLEEETYFTVAKGCASADRSRRQNPSDLTAVTPRGSGSHTIARLERLYFATP